jgi:hypothetical protein
VAIGRFRRSPLQHRRVDNVFLVHQPARPAGPTVDR